MCGIRVYIGLLFAFFYLGEAASAQELSCDPNQARWVFENGPSGGRPDGPQAAFHTQNEFTLWSGDIDYYVAEFNGLPGGITAGQIEERYTLQNGTPSIMLGEFSNSWPIAKTGPLTRTQVLTQTANADAYSYKSDFIGRGFYKDGHGSSLTEYLSSAQFNGQLFYFIETNSRLEYVSLTLCADPPLVDRVNAAEKKDSAPSAPIANRDPIGTDQKLAVSGSNIQGNILNYVTDPDGDDLEVASLQILPPVDVDFDTDGKFTIVFTANGQYLLNAIVIDKRGGSEQVNLTFNVVGIVAEVPDNDEVLNETVDGNSDETLEGQSPEETDADPELSDRAENAEDPCVQVGCSDEACLDDTCKSGPNAKLLFAVIAGALALLGFAGVAHLLAQRKRERANKRAASRAGVRGAVDTSGTPEFIASAREDIARGDVVFGAKSWSDIAVPPKFNKDGEWAERPEYPPPSGVVFPSQAMAVAVPGANAELLGKVATSEPVSGLQTADLQTLQGKYAHVETAYHAVGRIGSKQVGVPSKEDWSLGTGVLVTSRHVLTNFHVFSYYRDWLQTPPAGIEFMAEYGKDMTDFYAFDGAPPRKIEGLDLVVFTLKNEVKNRKPLNRVNVETAGLANVEIVVISYPDPDPKMIDQEVLDLVEPDPIWAVKRLSVGKIFTHSTQQGDYVQAPVDHDVHASTYMPAICHNASTLGGSSGAPLVNLKGEWVGVHFNGRSRFNDAEAANLAMAIKQLEDIDFSTKKHASRRDAGHA